MFKKNLYNEQSRNKNIFTISLRWRLITGISLFVWIISVIINAQFMRKAYFSQPNEIIYKLQFCATIIITLWLTIKFQFLYNNCPYFLGVAIFAILGSSSPIIELLMEKQKILIETKKILNIDKAYFFNLLFLTSETIVVSAFMFINTNSKKIGLSFVVSDLLFVASILAISNLLKSKYALFLLFLIVFIFIIMQFSLTTIIFEEGYIWTELSILLMLGIVGAQIQVPLKWEYLLEIKFFSWITLVSSLFAVPLIFSLFLNKINKYNQVISFSPLILMPLICLTMFYLHGDISEVKNVKFIAYSLFTVFFLFLHIFKNTYKTIQKKILFPIILVWINMFILMLFLVFYTPEKIYSLTGLNVDLLTTIIFGFLISLIVTIFTILDLRWMSKPNKKLDEKPNEQLGIGE